MPANVDLETLRHGTTLVKRGFAKMQKGGVVMDVTNAEQARIAEEAGAVAVMALERVPADIRAEGGVSRMSQTRVISEIIDTVTIPVMAKCRIGHFVEAQLLQELGVDMVDESEVLTPADPYRHVWKNDFETPFVCGARNLGEAVRRIVEGAAMVRTKGEAGTGDVVEAVRHRLTIKTAIDTVVAAEKDQLAELAAQMSHPFTRLAHDVTEGLGVAWEPPADVKVVGDLTAADVQDRVLDTLLDVKRLGRLPVVDFAAGGIATPADAALMMQLGVDGVFVGSGIFKSDDPEVRARAIVEATTHFDDPKAVIEVSRTLGGGMRGRDAASMTPEEQLQGRGW